MSETSRPPRSAFDAVTLAYRHAVRQVWPIHWSQWWRLALLGLATSECSTSGCNVRVPGGGAMPQDWPDWSGLDWMVAHPVATFAIIFGVVAVVGLLGLLATYISSVCRFVLVETLVQGRCDGIRVGWRRWNTDGRSFFAWRLVYQVVCVTAAFIAIGGPLGAVVAAGWFRDPVAHVAPLILIGCGAAAAFGLVVIVGVAVGVVAKDCLPAMMAIEHVRARDAWRRLLAIAGAEKAAFAGYLAVKLLMTIGAAIVMFVVLLVLLAPVGLGVAVGTIATHGGVPFTMGTVPVLFGAVGVAAVAVALLVGVPFTVFFPAYGLYFLAARHPALDGWLNQADRRVSDDARP